PSVGYRQDTRPVELRRHAPGNLGPAGHCRRHRTFSIHSRGTRSMKPSRFLIPLLAALTMASQVQAAEPFKVGYIRVMDDAQAIAAYEGKFYEKQGLDVQLVEFKSGTDLIKAIVGGQLRSEERRVGKECRSRWATGPQNRRDGGARL